MTAPVKKLGQSRWKRLRGETTTPTRQMFRHTSVDVSDIAVHVKPDAQAPAVAEPAQSPDLAKFMSAFGSLKEKSVFGDDAVGFQRELREEWR